MKHNFAIRLSLGDPDYNNNTGPIGALLSNKNMNFLREATSDVSGYNNNNNNNNNNNTNNNYYYNNNKFPLLVFMVASITFGTRPERWQ